MRKQWVDISGLRIPLPAPEDLIIMKAVSGRGRDVADIESIIDAQPRIDFRMVRRWVKEFASVLEMPEILKDVEKIIKKHAK